MSSQHEQHIELAKRHVIDGERRVAEQATRLEQLARDGLDTSEAERLLALLQSTLTLMREHLRMLLDGRI